MSVEPAGAAGSGTPASSAAWMDAFADITDNYASLSTIHCPNCGAETLRVRFIGARDVRAASGYLWCDTCLTGIVLSRMGVPDGADIIPFDMPGEERPPMPDYALVWPQEEG
jgi:hypothetical protein